MKNLMSKGKFAGKLVVFYQGAKVSRELLQELIEDGLLQARGQSQGGHGSTARLTQVIHASSQVKSIPTRTVQRYIQSCIDLKWGKLKDGTMGFKYNGKQVVTWPEETWYDWKGNNTSQPKVDKDVVEMLKNMKHQISLAKKRGGKVEHENLLPEIDKLIAQATAQVHTV